VVDADWMTQRRSKEWPKSPISIYEVHLGSWQRKAEEGNRPLSYLELAETLLPYVLEMGYTHIELLPIAEHPFEGSWGYQVTNYYAPTSRHGNPDELRHFIDKCHQAGIAVSWTGCQRIFRLCTRWPNSTAPISRAHDPLGRTSSWGTPHFLLFAMKCAISDRERAFLARQMSHRRAVVDGSRPCSISIIRAKKGNGSRMFSRPRNLTRFIFSNVATKLLRVFRNKPSQRINCLAGVSGSLSGGLGFGSEHGLMRRLSEYVADPI
jgi:hypothetical protein